MLKRFPLFNATDVDEHRLHSQTLVPEIVRVEQLRPGRFSSAVDVMLLGDTRTGTAIASVAHMPDLEVEAVGRRAVRLVIPTTSAIAISSGARSREILGGGLAGLLPSNPLRLRYTPGHHLVLRVDRDKLDLALQEMDCEAEVDRILDAVFFEPRLPGLQDFAEHLRRLIATIDDKPARILDQPTFRRAHEQNLVLRLADILALVRERGSLAVGRNSAALRRAEEYIRAYAERHVDLVAMARHAGLSLRSLQILFRANHDCTIVQFIRRHRLALARERLERGETETTVAEIARRSGFTHLGHFTTAYKEAFGEQPRQTRQRARREPDP
ncbi:hypothetical protein CCR97_05355 [Rhodoplanes elegans]|uniref:HTH araC/xylS-type domain-containing protein n=1 Tax=Rhodoplanes elegans TaxID=29408 RepID=A0A327KSD2_9BRAD|nr:helix-turn-helix domain-containing protein [Rhodoplanes elegans]MBK5957637.1 hypothetical protein [Rhodoplanes elegans]RAI41271.1 hypothetical protein CH338_03675 [Rhodoplanes elegans]